MPFFLHAPSAVVSGRGEVVKPVRVGVLCWVVLVNQDSAWEQMVLPAAGIDGEGATPAVIVILN